MRSADSGDVRILHPWRNEADDDAPLHRVHNKPCLHRRIRLDKDAHRVYCRECDAEVDPFAFLFWLTGEWERWVSARESAEKRFMAAQARLDETLRLERNARARVKRLDSQAPLPTVPWGDGSPAV